MLEGFILFPFSFSTNLHLLFKLITIGQILSFAWVKAHHQNRKAERWIRLLQEQTHTMLIHANHHWPSAIKANLWLYAIRMVNKLMVFTPSLQDKNTLRLPIQQVFSSTKVLINPKHFFHFGCPSIFLTRTSREALLSTTIGRSDRELESTSEGRYNMQRTSWAHMCLTLLLGGHRHSFMLLSTYCFKL